MREDARTARKPLLVVGSHLRLFLCLQSDTGNWLCFVFLRAAPLPPLAARVEGIEELALVFHLEEHLSRNAKTPIQDSLVSLGVARQISVDG
jgi:hypothetical protein